MPRTGGTKGVLGNGGATIRDAPRRQASPRGDGGLPSRLGRPTDRAGPHVRLFAEDQLDRTQRNAGIGEGNGQRQHRVVDAPDKSRRVVGTAVYRVSRDVVEPRNAEAAIRSWDD